MYIFETLTWFVDLSLVACIFFIAFIINSDLFQQEALALLIPVLPGKAGSPGVEGLPLHLCNHRLLHCSTLHLSDHRSSELAPCDAPEHSSLAQGDLTSAVHHG